LDVHDSTYENPLPVRSGADGAYGFSGLADGKYSVNAEAAGFVKGSYRFTLPGVPQTQRSIDLRLQEAGSISGTVFDQKNHPVQNAYVSVVCEGANGAVVALALPTPITDDEGNFRASGFRP
jgi:hypothetical protein